MYWVFHRARGLGGGWHCFSKMITKESDHHHPWEAASVMDACLKCAPESNRVFFESSFSREDGSPDRPFSFCESEVCAVHVSEVDKLSEICNLNKTLLLEYRNMTPA